MRGGGAGAAGAAGAAAGALAGAASSRPLGAVRGVAHPTIRAAPRATVDQIPRQRWTCRPLLLTVPVLSAPRLVAPRRVAAGRLVVEAADKAALLQLAY